MTVIPAPGRLRQEEREIEASLSYIARPYLKKQNKKVSDDPLKTGFT
jgi:hypothetical protein